MEKYKITIKGQERTRKLERSKIRRVVALTEYAILEYLKKKKVATLPEIEQAVISHKVSFPIDSDFVMAVVSTRGGILSIVRGVKREIKSMLKKGYLQVSK